MDTKDNIINDISLQKLLHDDNYYKHIFKKTEKIVSVVFYILHNIDHDKKSETHTSNIASKAHLVHEHALRTLDARPAAAQEVLEQFAGALIALDSTFRVVATTRTISPDVFAVVVAEIDVVLRGLRSYIGTGESPLAGLSEASVTTRKSAPVAVSAAAPQAPRSTARTNATPAVTTVTRRDRIKTILEAKREATIKDIAEIINDVSEKTLQRELNAMIAENIVKRQGERRWSKYSLF